MSTIEEAREQARAAAEIVEHRLAGRWLGGSLIREADKDVPALRTSLHALRTLLDATEPQETTTPAAKSQLEAVTNAIEKVLDGQDALHCTRVWEAWGYGTMSEEDFSPVTNDAEAVHEIASAVLEALEPRPITDEMVEAATQALGVHRWKTMGVNTVECECGEIIGLPDAESTGDLIEDSILQAFPADLAFRKHIAHAALEAAEEARR